MPSDDRYTQVRVETDPDGDDPSVSLRITIDPKAVHLRNTQLGPQALLDGWSQPGRAGEASFPVKTFRVALPNQLTSKGPVVSSIVKECRLDHRTKAPELHRIEGKETRPVVRPLDIERIGQTAIVPVEVNPIFIAPDGHLALASELHVALPLAKAVSLDFEKDAQASGSDAWISTVQPVSQAQFDRLYQLARAAVVNPEAVVSYLDRPNHPIPRRLATQWDYLIITDDTTWNADAKTPTTAISPSIIDAFEELASWKNSHGLKARVVTVTDIVQSRVGVGFGEDFVSTAADLQEAIRRFVRWAHDNWGTAYVLLGGDERIVPIRRLSIGRAPRTQLPTDLYYAALSSLNDDWHEGATKDELNYGEYGADRLTPNVSIGRAPASTATEAGNFVAKVKRYEGAQPLWLRSPFWKFPRVIPKDVPPLKRSAWQTRILYAATKWGGDKPTAISPSVNFPPSVNQYSLAPNGKRAVINLLSTVHVPMDPNPGPGNPDFDHFKQPSGTVYYKIQLTPTYKYPSEIVANTASGNQIPIPHTSLANATTPGWYFTDWLDHDGPSHDASGGNPPSWWVIIYMPAGEVPETFDLRLSAGLRSGYNLLSHIGEGDFRYIPYDANAATTGHGWYFAKSATNQAPSPVDSAGNQTPTDWLTVYAGAEELSPLAFVLDPTEVADTMREQEELRKQIRRDIPAWRVQSALYQDVVDVPLADRQGIDMQYYTQNRLRAKLNRGQHIVAIGSHGLPQLTCDGGDGGAFDLALADQLTNAAGCSIFYVNSCLTNRYTEDCLSRHLVMKNAHGGGVGYVGHLDQIEIDIGHGFEKKFFSDLAKCGGVLGIAVDGRAAMIDPGIYGDGLNKRFTILMTGLVGDPAMRVHGFESQFIRYPSG